MYIFEYWRPGGCLTTPVRVPKWIAGIAGLGRSDAKSAVRLAEADGSLPSISRRADKPRHARRDKLREKLHLEQQAARDASLAARGLKRLCPVDWPYCTGGCAEHANEVAQGLIAEVSDDVLGDDLDMYRSRLKSQVGVRKSVDTVTTPSLQEVNKALALFGMLSEPCRIREVKIPRKVAVAPRTPGQESATAPPSGNVWNRQPGPGGFSRTQQRPAWCRPAAVARRAQAAQRSASTSASKVTPAISQSQKRLGKLGSKKGSRGAMAWDDDDMEWYDAPSTAMRTRAHHQQPKISTSSTYSQDVTETAEGTEAAKVLDGVNKTPRGVVENSFWGPAEPVSAAAAATCAAAAAAVGAPDSLTTQDIQQLVDQHGWYHRFADVIDDVLPQRADFGWEVFVSAWQDGKSEEESFLIALEASLELSQKYDLGGPIHSNGPFGSIDSGSTNMCKDDELEHPALGLSVEPEDVEGLAILIDMGFDRSGAKAALSQASGDVQAAADALMGHATADSDRVYGGTDSESGVPGTMAEDSSVGVLVDMGFHEQDARSQLAECGGDVDQAAAILAASYEKPKCASGRPDNALNRRIDPTDGASYTRAEFVAHYGGSTEWDLALPESVLTTTDVDEAALFLLCSMLPSGFDKDEAAMTLLRVGGDVQAAINVVFESDGCAPKPQSMAASGYTFARESVRTAASSSQFRWPAELMTLMGMGFDEAQARDALTRTDGDLDTALAEHLLQT